MQAPVGYKEIDVPPHLVELFNKAFEHDFSHCKLFLREAVERVEDSDIWAMMIDSVDNGVLDDDEAIIADDWKPRKKIVWH